jgi:predicted AAA+ superfamily ATPase
MLHRFLKKPNNSILLLGPRGTGKSTWIKQIFPQAPTYDLLNSSEALRLARKPSVLFDELRLLEPHTWVVIDEIQKVPALMDEVHRLIENHALRFVLSGSSARKLKSHGTNLLAGRALWTPFFPLVSAEVDGPLKTNDDYIFGMLPKAFLADRPQAFLRSYVQTYLKEEIQSEALTRNIGGFSRFLEIAARQNGQVTNVTNIARDAQVARQTVQGYFQILVDTLIGFWLPAWKLKQSIKQIAHPKFYFFDAGVCRALSGRLAYPPTDQEKGPLFETWILHEIRAFLAYQELDYPLYYWSSYDQVEVDVLLETQDSFLAIEIKSTSHWERSFNRGLHRLKKDITDKPVRLQGVYCGERALEMDGVHILPVGDFLKALWAGHFTA